MTWPKAVFLALFGATLLAAAFGSDISPALRGMFGCFGVMAVTSLGLVERRSTVDPADLDRELRGSSGWWIPQRSLSARMAGVVSSLALAACGGFMVAAVLLREVPRSASFWMVAFGILALLFFGYTAVLWTSGLVSKAPGTAEVNEKGISDHNRYHSLINWDEIHHYAVAASGLQLHLHDREAFRGSRMVRFWDRLSRAMGYGTLNIAVPPTRLAEVSQALDTFSERHALRQPQ